MTKLSIHKTLKENLPLQIDNSKDEIHFTEDGRIYISKNDGTFQSCNTGDIIKEISNPLTTKPLEYGYIKINENQSIMSKDSIIAINNIEGNLLVDNNSIMFKKGVIYQVNINMNIKLSIAGGAFYALKDVDTGEVIGDILKTVTITHSNNISRSNNVNFQICPNKDIIAYLRFLDSDLQHTIEGGNITIQEIRNNPVNQYGGFESKVLFEGEANSVGEYILNDDISNYDYIIVKTSLSYDTNTNVYTDNTVILVNDIVFNKTSQFVVMKNSNIGSLHFSLKDNKTIKIDNRSAHSDWTYLGIDKITGFKGQLPSLLSGGEF